jgi:hypothetical protein
VSGDPLGESRRPWVEEEEHGTRIARGLVVPVDAVGYNDGWAVAERDGDRISHVAEDGTVTTLSEAVTAPISVATDGRRIAVGTQSGELLILDGEEVVTVATGQTDIGPIVADAEEIFWAAAGTLRRAAWDDPQVEDLVPCHADYQLLLTPDALYLSDGATDENPTAATGRRWDRAAEEATTILDQDVFRTGLRPAGLALAGGDLVVSIVLRGWPYAGVLCLAPAGGGQLSCFSYSPPRASGIALFGGEAVWRTRRSIAAVDRADPQAFRILGAWHNPAKLLRGSDPDAVYWIDRDSGSVWRAAVTP